ncbi:hypothetical protein [Sphingomonas oryzagri]|uniref:Uncharacterized protein n=1 Tax=Sphingomonas oryzagri TaxID=3042314 RepID=A0ABT6N1P7_9SPHN|nr:hypothetical protein [Sphingomonas oryzagri]MDH7638704.1 hypothetical protein [Sphingomonas oryzagri]
MDIHKVKPVHGWREFFGEVGIIVLGVMIALGAEQIAEILHWREQVLEARDTMRSELRDEAVLAIERKAMAACALAYLKSVDTVVRTGKSIDPNTHPDIPVRIWTTDAWTVVTTSQASAHMKPDEMLEYAGQFSAIRIMANWNEQETQLLSDLEAPAIDATGRDRILLASARLRSLNRWMVIASDQYLANIGEMGIRPLSENVADIRHGRDQCGLGADGKPLAARPEWPTT